MDSLDATVGVLLNAAGLVLITATFNGVFLLGCVMPHDPPLSGHTHLQPLALLLTAHPVPTILQPEEFIFTCGVRFEFFFVAGGDAEVHSGRLALREKVRGFTARRAHQRANCTALTPPTGRTHPPIRTRAMNNNSMLDLGFGVDVSKLKSSYEIVVLMTILLAVLGTWRAVEAKKKTPATAAQKEATAKKGN